MKTSHHERAHKSRVKEAPQARMPAAASADPAARRQMIAAAAYRRAELRGFAPGREVNDWLAAEAEIDAAMATKMH